MRQYLTENDKIRYQDYIHSMNSGIELSNEEYDDYEFLKRMERLEIESMFDGQRDNKC